MQYLNLHLVEGEDWMTSCVLIENLGTKFWVAKALIHSISLTLLPQDRQDFKAESVQSQTTATKSGSHFPFLRIGGRDC